MSLGQRLERALPAGALEWWHKTRARVRGEGVSALPAVFPALVRRLGKTRLPDAARERHGEREIDFATWRLADVGGALLLEAAPLGASDHLRLYQGGDLEERTIALRAMAWLPLGADSAALFNEVQRTNIGRHVEAALFDSNVVARAMNASPAVLDVAAFRRLMLKLAFMDLPVERLFGALDFAEPGLSSMLEDFAEEREAAGRTVWADTCRFVGAAPFAGRASGTAGRDATERRLMKGLDDERPAMRLAALDGAARLGRDAFWREVVQRVAHDLNEEVRARLETLRVASPR